MDNKEYDLWNEIKKNIQFDTDRPDYFPQEGEVWMSSLGKNIGFEQNGSGDSFSRPVLIVKKFNNRMFWIVTLSTKQKSFDFYFNYTDLSNQKVSVILAQMKLVSLKRLRRKLYEISGSLFDEIKQKLKALF
ncbi:MAG: type II toxin-antitoxin system PemK/MazF family toxin [bacterium]|nr:type II toxin-antitoxin system PemK/MazF family toxin [bacterium]